jgi:hypothetical protein
MNLTQFLEPVYICCEMPSLHLSRPHSFSLDEAAQKLRALMKTVQVDLARFIDNVEWAKDGRSANVRGGLFKGRFVVDAKTLNVELNVSVLATLFMDKIRTRIESTLDEHFVATKGPTAPPPPR